MTPLEAVLRRDRIVVVSGVTGLAALAWAYMVYLAQGTSDMDMGMAMPQMQTWGSGDLVLMFAMWVVMMVAMMVPTAAPMVLVFAAMNRRGRERQPYLPTGTFLLGYVVVWSGFAALATLANWGLHANGLLSTMMGSATSIVGGGLLLAAGIFQWTPFKYVCLTRCRSPIGFLLSEWREGADGALVLGLRHGLLCLGCCWALMGLLFVVGVMNLLWIAALAGFVLVEKVAPGGVWVSRASGLLLVGWGALMIAGVLG